MQCENILHRAQIGQNENTHVRYRFQVPFALTPTAQCLERRMNLWTEGDLDKLLEEGRTIQQRLLSSPN